jgi:hypothetical protein
LIVVTPFETVRCRVDIEDGAFECAPDAALAFAGLCRPFRAILSTCHEAASCRVA